MGVTQTPRGRHARPEAAAAGSRTGAGPGDGPGPWSLRGLVLVLGLVLVGAVARLWRLPTAYDLFIDEVTYTIIARNVAAGDGVLLHGEPFHLHPAGFFGTLSLALPVLGLEDAGVAESSYAMRVVPALLGAVTPAVLAMVVRAVTRSWLAALGAGAVLALEPFLIRFDSRVLLEAQAMLLAAGSLLLVAHLAGRRDEPRRDTALAVAAGVLACGALLTKETYAFVSALPLLVLLVTGWALPRRASALAFATVVAGYAVYVAGVAAAGQLGDWFAQKTRGVGRLLGIVQETGFNVEGSPGFLDRLLANLGFLGSTYLVIALGGLATAWLAWRAWRGPELPVRRGPLVVLLVWVVCADAHVAYALTLGTLEEQMFYLLVATAVPVLVVAATAALRQRAGVGAGLPVRWLAGALVVSSVLLVWQAAVWWRVRSVPDDGYLRLLEWSVDGLPEGSRVATTEETLQFLLDDVLVTRLETGAEVTDFGATHVLLVEELVEQGYSRVDAELLDLVEGSEPVFRSRTRTVGELLVVEVPEEGPDEGG